MEAVLLTIYLIIIPIMIYFAIRNIRVAKFCHKVNNMTYDWSIKNLDKQSAYEWFYPQLPSYDSLLFSFKPLKLKNYFKEEDLKRIING